jgi:ATP-binding cassette subfamily B protein
MTVGMMLSVSYIIGQLNAPVDRLVGFFHTAQDARIALERTAEIHERKDETELSWSGRREIPLEGDLDLEEVSFRYEGAHGPVLKGVSLRMEAGTTTAIVGPSGSGKTTLLKLLLRFYSPTEGRILLGGLPLERYDPSAWRERIGVVMQEGELFNDSIERNIALVDERVEAERMDRALKGACLSELIEQLPKGLDTKIGREGMELSTGQKQRILIARAIYKDPAFLFFDEATSSLDATNERAVMENLQRFMKGRTSLVIAHRLSTVRKADRIAVLDQGRILEEGDHQSLVEKGGAYFHLIRDQLELEHAG